MHDKVTEQAAKRESAVTHTIGIELADAPGVLAVVRRDGDTVIALETFPFADYAHPLGALAEALDLVDFAISDDDEPEPAILPLGADIFVALGQPLYTAPLSLRADQLDAPVGAYWQVRDASDETSWHDLLAVVECEDLNCEYGADEDDEDAPGCTVLVSQAWAAGFAHMPVAEMVSVRIPASVTA